jgi:hypothetical protein
MESHHDLISLFEHDLFGKPVSTFPDHALEIRAGPDCCGQRFERIPALPVADIRMKHHVARGQGRQSEPRADIDRPARCDAAAKGRDREACGDGGAGRGDTATDEDLRPGDAGRLQRVDRHAAHAAGIGLRCEP